MSVFPPSIDALSKTGLSTAKFALIVESSSVVVEVDVCAVVVVSISGCLRVLTTRKAGVIQPQLQIFINSGQCLKLTLILLRFAGLNESPARTSRLRRVKKRASRPDCRSISARRSIRKARNRRRWRRRRRATIASRSWKARRRSWARLCALQVQKF